MCVWRSRVRCSHFYGGVPTQLDLQRVDGGCGHGGLVLRRETLTLKHSQRLARQPNAGEPLAFPRWTFQRVRRTLTTDRLFRRAVRFLSCAAWPDPSILLPTARDHQ